MVEKPKVQSFKADTNLSPTQVRVVLVLLGVIAVLGGGIFWVLWGQRSVFHSPAPQVESPQQEATPVQEPAAQKTESDLIGSITAAELTEFDNAVFELDPEQRLVTEIVQPPDTEIIVDVTVTLGFAAMDEVAQDEAAIAMQRALATICECRPILKLNTAAGQRVLVANDRKITR